MYDRLFGLEGGTGRQIMVWPVPYEGTASFGKGTRLGPQAILRASYEIETWDERLHSDLEDFFCFKTLPVFEPKVHGPEVMLKAMGDYLSRTFPGGDVFLLTLGGEHSVALPPITFYKRFYSDLVVVQFDAHADLRIQYQGSPFSHACVMSQVRQLGIDVFQVGIRSLSQKESMLVSQEQGKGLHVFFAWELGDPKSFADYLSRKVGERPVYLTFDVDCLDPSIMPGTGTPEPGGITFAWFEDFCHAFFTPEQRLIGFDLCELAPLPTGVLSESVAVQVIKKILLSVVRESGN